MSTPPPPTRAHPGGFICFVFPPSLYHRGYVEYHTTFGGTPENSIKHEKMITHPGGTGGHHSSSTPTGMGIPVPAWRKLLHPITVGRSSLPVAPTPPVPTAAAPPARLTSFRVRPAYRYWYFHSCRGSSPDDSGSSYRTASHYDSYKRPDDAAP